jgi:hypothetical protein
MSFVLGPLLVDAADPVAAESFWARALGTGAQQHLLTFRPQKRPKTVKNRVHLDLYVRDVAPLLDMGAEVLAQHRDWATLSDVEGNEFCAFPDPTPGDGPPARAFAVCTDSDRPEDLAAWWAALVGADLRAGPDGTPRWLYDAAGWERLIWKFVRVDDLRVVPNRWQPTLRADPGVRADPQGNEFSVVSPGRPAG